MPHLISCDWKCNRGIDVQFVQWDILSQGLKSGLVFFFCQDVLMFCQLNNQQYKLFKRIRLIQVIAEIANV